MLHIDSVSKSYGKKEALKGVSFDAGVGFYAILGPNGSGKTTLISILTCAIRQDSGNITYNGADIRSMGKEYRAKIGIVPQDPGIILGFTLLEFLEYMAYLKGIKRCDVLREAKKAAHTVALDECLHQRLSTFSGGMKQRAAIASGLLGSPEILILDEPTAGLDPGQRLALKNTLADYSRTHTVILATHIVSDVEEIADRLILIKEGRLVACDTPEEVMRPLCGKIWSVCDPAFTPEKDSIIRVSHAEGRTKFRIFSEKCPTPGAVSERPDLEDCCFVLLGDREGTT